MKLEREILQRIMTVVAATGRHVEEMALTEYEYDALADEIREREALSRRFRVLYAEPYVLTMYGPRGPTTLLRGRKSVWT